MSNSPANPDFLAHLQAELGGARDSALSLLGDWLVNYQPERHYELNFLAQSSPSAAPESELEAA